MTHRLHQPFESPQAEKATSKPHWRSALEVGGLLVILLAGASVVVAAAPWGIGTPEEAQSALHGRWGLVGVAMTMDVAILYEDEGKPTLWLGFGPWELHEPEPATEESQAMLGQWGTVERARFIRSGGVPVTISAYDNGLPDGDGQATGELTTSVSHTYSVIEYDAMPTSKALVVRIESGEPFTAAVTIPDGRVHILEQGAWVGAPVDESLRIHVPRAHVLIEDGCTTSPEGKYACAQAGGGE